MKPARRAPGRTRKLVALPLLIAVAMSGVSRVLQVVLSHPGRTWLVSASTEQVALQVSLEAG